MRRGGAILALLLVGVLTACNPSPEAGRQRGGGPGADVGNRNPEVQMHGRTNPNYRTPLSGRAIEATHP